MRGRLGEVPFSIRNDTMIPSRLDTNTADAALILGMCRSAFSLIL